MPWSLQVETSVMSTAARRPASALPAISQFLRPTAVERRPVRLRVNVHHDTQAGTHARCKVWTRIPGALRPSPS